MVVNGGDGGIKKNINKCDVLLWSTSKIPKSQHSAMNLIHQQLENVITKQWQLQNTTNIAK